MAPKTTGIAVEEGWDIVMGGLGVLEAEEGYVYVG